MTTGEYLRGARERKGLSLFDVALRTETDPPVSAAARSRLIGAIEEGLVVPDLTGLEALQRVYAFDWADLEQATGSRVASAIAPALRSIR